MAQIHAASFATPRPWRADEFASLLAAEETLCLTRGDGFLLGRVIADEAELLTLAVAPFARRHGVGQELVTEFLDRVRTDGAASVFLEVAADNHPAIALYNSVGFQAAGTRRAYYRAPDGTSLDAKIMSRPL